MLKTDESMRYIKSRKMKIRSIFRAMSISIATTIIFSCNVLKKPMATNKSTNTKFDLALAKKQIEDINQSYMAMVTNGDSIGVASLYAEDARLLFAGMPPIAGRANIQRVFARLINSGVTKLDLETIEVFGTEELLAEEGKVTIFVKGKAVAENKSIILWKKENGKWLVYRDIANSNLK